ncbi:MAG TPA: chloride channel protein, partial [Kiloniellales bacterium]|nr:chloride channel protein [Kiloniellales bacterium]
MAEGATLGPEPAPVGLAPAGLLFRAVLAGLLGGAGAVAFREVVRLVNQLTYGFDVEQMASAATSLDWWWPPLVLGAGGLGVGLYVHFLLPQRRPHGVADVIQAMALRSTGLDLRQGLLTALGAAASLGFGASVGREGPVVHLGASVAAWLGRLLAVPQSARRVLLGAGVAGAIAASFNAPLAGAFFALEVVVARFAFPAFAPVALGAAAGTIVGLLRYGGAPAFVVPQDWGLVSLSELPAFLILGLLCAVAAWLFAASTFLVDRAFARLAWPRTLRPAAAGLVVGALAIVDPRILGVGYEATSAVLAGGLDLEGLVLLAVLKMTATALCLGAGFVGGVFSPALFLGCMLGGSFGLVAAMVQPDLASAHGAYALVGMGAVAGAVLGAPISTAIMMVELTGDL